MTQPVELQRSHGIGRVTFFHEKANALSIELVRKLQEGIEQLSQDRGIKAIVLGSAGDGAFCGGAHLGDLAACKAEGEVADYFFTLGRLLLTMVKCSCPIITIVQGRVVGGGVGIVAAADYAIASSRAEVRLPELQSGIAPSVISPFLIHRIGSAHFEALALDTEWRGAEWAERIGLYSRTISDPTQLQSATDHLLIQLSGRSSAASAIKQLAWERFETTEETLREKSHQNAALYVKSRV